MTRQGLVAPMPSGRGIAYASHALLSTYTTRRTGNNMENNQIDMVLALRACRILDTRHRKFVLILAAHAAFKPGTALTDRQGRLLAELFHKYRSQIGSLGHSLHCELCAKALDAIEDEEGEE
jgi:hypothetical protein